MMGFLIGVVNILLKYETSELSYGLLSYLGLVFGTCAVFYIFFLCRVLGAGDIKLIAVCVGFLGIEGGAQMILCGLLLSVVVESFRANVWKCGYLSLRCVKIRLAPYLLFGYCLWEMVFRK